MPLAEQAPVVVAALPGLVGEVEVEHPVESRVVAVDVTRDHLVVLLLPGGVGDCRVVTGALPTGFTQDDRLGSQPQRVQGVGEKRLVGLDRIELTLGSPRGIVPVVEEPAVAVHVDVVEFGDQPDQILAPLAGAGQECLSGEVVGDRQRRQALEVLHLTDNLGHGEGGRAVPVHDLLVAQAHADHLVRVGLDDGQRRVDLPAGLGLSGDVDTRLHHQRKIQAGDRLQDASGVVVGAPGADGDEAQLRGLLQCRLQALLTFEGAQGAHREADSPLGSPIAAIGRGQRRVHRAAVIEGGVVVDDDTSGHCVGQGGPGRVGQGDGESLVGFGHGVTADGHRHLLGGHAGGESEGARSCRVVLARAGGAVGGGVIDPNGVVRGAVKPGSEGELACGGIAFVG